MRVFLDLTDQERPTLNVSDTVPWAGILDWMERQTGEVSIYFFASCSSHMWTVTHPFCQPFSAMMDCAFLNGRTKLALPTLCCFCLTFFITAMSKVTAIRINAGYTVSNLLLCLFFGHRLFWCFYVLVCLLADCLFPWELRLCFALCCIFRTWKHAWQTVDVR